MYIGVPKEIKTHEYRVGLTPDNITSLTSAGHTCYVENNAGMAIGFENDEYKNAGGIILQNSAEVYEKSTLIVKVKEPQPSEYPLVKKDQLLFGYLHLAADKSLTENLQKTGAICIAYETVEDVRGHLPLLAPMSEVAGRLSVQAGIHHLENPQGGSGILLGGVPGVAPAHVLIIGGGVVGTQAAQMAVGLGADVTIVDRSLPRLRLLDEMFQGRVKTSMALPTNIERLVINADLVIGAVLVSGSAAPKVLKKELLKKMKRGSVIVDVAIDQGGCFETSRPTTHDKPTFVVDGIIHYCVANIPGAVARTSTQALTNATFPYTLLLANKGKDALLSDPLFIKGVNIVDGQITHQAVAQSLGLNYKSAVDLLF